jgi:hypothetical protein
MLIAQDERVNKQQESLALACDALGLAIVLDFEVRLRSGRTLKSEALVEGVGPPRGMLVFSKEERVDGAGPELVAMGYGYSVYAPPPPGRAFDLDAYRAMFAKWNEGQSR